MRGADRPEPVAVKEGVGSSPRAWGRRFTTRWPPRPSRFIPTCVGQTAASCSGRARPSVHPHVRGADGAPCAPTQARLGSSPRAWGRLELTAGDNWPDRFIPTCVGQTVWHVHSSRSKTVHPHVRGADVIVFPSIAADCGSSPRAWGRQQPERGDFASRRFIPTCVGQTLMMSPCILPSPVHPHVRGADRAEVMQQVPHFGSSPRAWGRRPRSGPKSLLFIGSSPRAWGRRRTVRPDTSPARFIPTCVGQTLSYERFFMNASVHPHVRGADVKRVRTGPTSTGSSPRAWGRLRPHPSLPLLRRFIPTCVGQTSRSATAAGRCSVHPHVRGADAASKVNP